MIRVPYWKQYRFELICLAPLVLFLFYFTFLLLVSVFKISLADPASGTITLMHFRRLFTQSEFRHAFANTLIIALGSLTIELLLGLVLALAMTVHGRGTGMIRSLLMLPLAIPTVVAAVMMSYMFSTSGWVNRILIDLGLINSNIVWLSGNARSLFAVMAADCWKVTPLVMLILLAGLQGIDRQLFRAARVDGAGPLYLFRRVTLPLLMPAITSAVIIRGIDAFRIFSLALILMGENLKVLGTYAYLEYVEYHNESLSAASAVVLFMLILAAIMIYIRLVGKKGFQTA